jgi:hypothetical protein
VFKLGSGPFRVLHRQPKRLRSGLKVGVPALKISAQQGRVKSIQHPEWTALLIARVSPLNVTRYGTEFVPERELDR